MSKLKKFIISIAVFLGIIIVIGFFLPSSVTVKRTITIKAPNENIYEYISHLKLFNKFSPWVKYDPKTQYIFTGVDGKVGSKMAWSSERKEVGKGTQTITALIPGKEVHIELDFGDEGIANSYFKLKMLADQKTQVTWGFDTQLGMNPMMRYMGLMLDHWVGPSYEEGLSNLKKLVESEYEPVDFSKLKVTILQVESKPIIYKKGQVKMDKKIMNTLFSHIQNMIQGVQEKFVYELKICHGHFPFTVKIEGKKAIIKNFLGEKVDRKVDLLEGADFEIKKDLIIVRSVNKELAGQAAANFEFATKIKGRDKRVFQDGIYIIKKNGKEI